MATFMDISLVNFMAPLFLFLFVFAVIYGILALTKFIKGVPGEQAVYAIIALVTSLFVTMSSSLGRFIGTLAPWFAALMIFIFLVFVVLKMFVGGDGTEFFTKLLTSEENPAVKWVLVVLFVLIVIISFTSTFGQDLTEQDPTQVSQLQEDINIIDTTPTMTIHQTTPSTTTTTGTGDFGTNVLNTITHPKILGLLLFTLICFFSILLLAKSNN